MERREHGRRVCGRRDSGRAEEEGGCLPSDSGRDRCRKRRSRRVDAQVHRRRGHRRSRTEGGVAPRDAVVDYLPSPLDVPPVKGKDPDTGKEIERPADDNAPFSALAFKIMTDPFVGQLTFIRVYSGHLKTGDSVYISGRSRTERIGRLLKMHANKREDITEIYAGDICAC